jgi:hypothetical protein
MGIEPTARGRRAAGFEDQGSHQTSFTSLWSDPPQVADAQRTTRCVEMFHQRYHVFSSRAENVARIRNGETSGIGEIVSQTLNDAIQGIPMQDDVTVSIVGSELDEAARSLSTGERARV